MKITNIPNQIIRGAFAPVNKGKIDTIVLHHMAHKTAGVKEVESWHINNGWTAIGYNYFICFDGTIYKGRGLNVGAGVANHNSHIISIGFQGDYHSAKVSMPDSQFNSGVELISYLQSILPNAKKVEGHKYFGGSVCPGTYFPLEEMNKLKKRGETMEKTYNKVNDCPDWSRATVQKLIGKGYLKGDENGNLGLNDTMIKILVINDRAGIYGN